jgi:peptidoglycan hydrolase-like protein with peptidoglycan-binding domain
MAFKQFSILPLLIVLLSSPVSADTLTADVQRMLNKLGYKAGSIDGAYGKKTKGALEAFYSDNGTSYDDKLDANELADLTKAMSAAGRFQYAYWL